MDADGLEAPTATHRDGIKTVPKYCAPV